MSLSLREIAALIRQQSYAEARSHLTAFLKQNPQHAEAWYMLSFAAETPQQRLQAAQRAADLQPDNERYAGRAAKLAAQQAQPPSWRRWVLPSAIMLVVVIAVVAAQVLANRSGSASDELAALPTFAELPSVTPSLEPTRNEQAEISVGSSPSPAPSPTATVTLAEPSATPTIETPEITATVTASPSSTATVTPVSLPPATSIPVTPQSVTPAAPPPAAVTLPTQQPVSVTPTITASPNASPPPTLVVVDIVPVGIGAAVPRGEMRVLEVTRPAEGLIEELAGSVPSAPPGQTWLVVEVLLICSGQDNCTPPTSAFTIRGNNGTSYSPAATFNLQPVFAPEIYKGKQAWGYLGFTVPTNETGVWLELNSGGTVVNFGLQ
ncbi:MAG: hypothetical protein K8I60_18815 [Anaerolineae bacterium]|nr:hypothetical protein [Anaerolineae bacterium]